MLFLQFLRTKIGKNFQLISHSLCYCIKFRQTFNCTIEGHIACISGDRRFKQWNGSVVESVVGVLLTQNVADHLSSAAYMSLVAKFPVRSTSIQQESMTVDGQRPVESSMASIGPTFDSDGNQYFVTEPEPDINQGPKSHMLASRRGAKTKWDYEIRT
ncbi:hypothetical protein Peur_020612 [Populus x canadensis]